MAQGQDEQRLLFEINIQRIKGGASEGFELGLRIDQFHRCVLEPAVIGLRVHNYRNRLGGPATDCGALTSGQEADQ